MAEPGGPNAPETPETEVDHDAGVGFASAASLAGRPRLPIAAEPEPEPVPTAQPGAEPGAEPGPATTVQPEPEPEPAPESAPEPAPPVVDQAEPPIAPPPRPVRPDAPDPIPAWARETPPAAAAALAGSRFGRRETPAEVEGAFGLFAVYALILFAVPTLGVSALIALLAVTGRPGPQGDVAASHFLFQQRTLWAGALMALLGAILIAVGLGVFVLFILAVWLILRGAAGVLKLREGRPIPDPRAWLL